jgi:RNA polymerase sigma factor (sigma-70 family)
MFSSDPSRLGSLARRVRIGDPAAEDEFVAMFYGEVQAAIGSKISNHHVVPDLTQDVMIAVLVGLREGRIRHPERLAQYVYGTVRHVVAAYLRKHGRPPWLEFPPVADEMLTQDELVAIREDLVSLYDAMWRLAPADRAILRLSVFDDLTSAEMASRLGMTPGQLRQRRSRAMRKIRSVMNRSDT